MNEILFIRHQSNNKNIYYDTKENESHYIMFLFFLEKMRISLQGNTIVVPEHSFLFCKYCDFAETFPSDKTTYSTICFRDTETSLLRQLKIKLNKVYSDYQVSFLHNLLINMEVEFLNSRLYCDTILESLFNEMMHRLSREISGECLIGDKASDILLGFDFKNIWTATDSYPRLTIFKKDNHTSFSLWHGELKKPIEKENDTMLINEASELAWVIREGGMGLSYRLTTDIHLNDIDKMDWLSGTVTEQDYSPFEWFFGKDIKPFNGEFDGDGHIISGLYYNRDFSFYNQYGQIGAALFPKVENFSVKNIGIENSFLSIYDNFSLAAIIGLSHNHGNGIISQSYVDSTVSLFGHDVGSIAGGGDLGENHSIIIERCYSLAKIHGNSYIGAFVGNSWTKNQWYIKDSYCVGTPYGAVWKMPVLNNVYSTEPGAGNLSTLISDQRSTDINNEVIEKFRYLKNKINNRLDEKWSIERMAAEVNLSKPHFFFIYKSLYHSSPITDLIHERVNSAKNLLEFSDIPIKKIVSILGYENDTSFSRQFKKIIGISPMQYRNKAKKTFFE